MNYFSLFFRLVAGFSFLFFLGNACAQQQWLVADTRPQFKGAAIKISAVGDSNARSMSDSLVRLRLEKVGAYYLAWAESRVPGPVEIELGNIGQWSISASPALPARRVVPANGRVVLSSLEIPNAVANRGVQLAFIALPGDPLAQPQDIKYRLPFESETIRVDQGPGGQFSHSDAQNLYAIDFALPEGTPIVAARDGIVMQVESGFEKAGLDKEAYGSGNFIRVTHSDGTMAVYAHIKTDGVLVRVGQRVRVGERIGFSGNTGFSTAPHLHFAVQVNKGMELVSIPVRIQGELGELQFSKVSSLD